MAAQVLAKYATEAEALGRLNHYGCSRAVLTGCKGLHWVGSCSMADTSQMPQMGGCMVVLGAVIGASGLHAQHVQRPSGGCNTCQGPLALTAGAQSNPRLSLMPGPCGDLHRGSPQWAEPVVPGSPAAAYMTMVFHCRACCGMGEVALKIEDGSRLPPQPLCSCMLP